MQIGSALFVNVFVENIFRLNRLAFSHSNESSFKE